MLLSRFVTLSRRFNCHLTQKVNRLVAFKSSQARTSTSRGDDEDLDAPVKYTSSAARHWKAKTTRLGYENTRLWYEPYVILVSLSVFLIYFTILREENDVDEELSRTLYSRIEGLEELQLKVSLEYNQKHNMDTSAIIKRLEEIEKEKTKSLES